MVRWNNLATATLSFDIGHTTFAEQFVVLENLTGLIISLHLMRHNSVIIDITLGFIPFP